MADQVRAAATGAPAAAAAAAVAPAAAGAPAAARTDPALLELIAQGQQQFAVVAQQLLAPKPRKSRLDKPKIEFSKSKPFLPVQAQVQRFIKADAEAAGLNPELVVLEQYGLPLGPGGNNIDYRGRLGDPLDERIFDLILDLATPEVAGFIQRTAHTWKSGHLAWSDIRDHYFPLGAMHRTRYQQEL